MLEEADFYRPAHRAIWRAMLRLADRGQPTDPVTVLGELDDSRRAGRRRRRPVPPHPRRGRAHRGQRRPLRPAGRRDGPAPAGHRPRHPPGPLRRRPRRAGPPRRRAGRHHDRRPRWASLGAAHPVRRHRRACPRSRSRSCPAGSGSMWPRSPPPPRPHRIWPACSPWPCSPPSPPAPSRSNPDPAGASRCACSWPSGMDAGTRKSSVFTALTQPVAEFERQQAAAALPAITETATLRRIADQAAAHAEAAASKAPIDQQEERQAEAIARAAEAANLIVPPVPRWLVDDATPEALAGLLATYGRIALLSPEGDVFDQMAGRYNQAAGPNLGVYLKGHAGDLLKVDRRGRPPEYVERPCLTIGLTVQPEVLQGLASRPGFRRPRAAGPVPLQPPGKPGRPPPARRPTRPRGGGRPLHPGAPSPGGQPDHPGQRRRPNRAHPRPSRRPSCCSGSNATWSPGWPPAAATWPTWPAGRPSSPAPPAASPPSCTWPATSATAGPNRSAPTPSPAPSGWPTTSSTTPGPCST